MVLAKAVASLAAKVRVSLWAKVVFHADVRVLIINLSIAGPNGPKFPINASIIRRVETGSPAWLIDNSAGDRAEFIAGVAGVVFRVVWLRTTVQDLAFNQIANGVCQCGREEGEGCEDVGCELHFL